MASGGWTGAPAIATPVAASTDASAIDFSMGAAAQAFLSACRDKLSVALQPIYDARSGALFAVEALTRGAPEVGFKSVHALYDEANRLSVLDALELQQIKAAIKAVDHVSTPHAPTLFVNIDTRLLLTRSNLINSVEDALRAANRPKQLLVFELSERHDKTSRAALSQKIRSVGTRGFQLALDDFGRGVSDMQALHSFDLDYLKIDRFFVDGVARDERKRFLVGRMVELAHLLGLKVIAEGLEDPTDLQTCADLGCDLSQGFLLGCPDAPENVAPRCETARESRKRGVAGDRVDTIREALVARAPAHYRTPLIDVVTSFSAPDAASVRAVVGDNDEPIGVLVERDLRRFIYSPFGLDLCRNSSSGITLESLMQRYPLASIETDVDRLIELLADADRDGVVITEGLRYLGFLPAAALVRLSSAKRLEMAEDANPLTRLPGNRVVERFIDEALEDADAPWRIAYFDFDNFKPFYDIYGFRIGDRAIRMFSDILKKTFSHRDHQICHIGGDDFFVGTQFGSDLDFIAAVRNCVSQFKIDAESLYSAEHREAGRIQATARDGKTVFHPLLRCSAAVMTCAASRSPLGADQLSLEIGRVKRAAKESETGVVRLSIADPAATIDMV